MNLKKYLENRIRGWLPKEPNLPARAYLGRSATHPKKILWAFVSVGTLVFVLWILRIFGVVGAEVDLLNRWLAIASSILFGIFIGIVITGKKLSVRGAIVNLLLTLILILFSPIIGIIIAVSLPISMQIMPIVAGGLSGGFALSFLWLIHWLRKRGYLSSTKIDWTDKY
jgi:hypothetical protein